MTTTLGGLLRQRAAARPEHPFLRTPAGPVTLGALDTAADRIAAGLRVRGIRAGDRVALAAPNVAEWLFTFFGAARLGAIVVTLNVRYRERELEHMLRQSGTRLLVSAAATADFDFEAFYPPFVARVPALEHIFFIGGHVADTRFERLLDGPAVDASVDGDLDVGLDGDAPAIILYTSGTTGSPKGATLTHRSLLASAAAEAAHLGMTADDVLLGVMPLNHVGGITCTILSALVAGGSVALQPAFSPDAALRAIADHRVTWMAGVPTMYTLMLARLAAAPDAVDTRTLRLAVIGGSNASPALCAAIRAALPRARLVNLYGLSESSGACVLSRLDDDADSVARTLGVVIGDFESRVVDDRDQPLPDGSDGELQLRGDCVARGYWELPEATRETFRDGWLATGDMVVREPDGHLALRGRKKEMFLQGGYNVYPVEVENVLGAHPAVALVAGIGIPDAVLGEIGCYFVVARAGVERPSVEALSSWCAARLADYKVPRRLEWVDELPLTPSGKVAKALLQERARQTP